MSEKVKTLEELEKEVFKDLQKEKTLEESKKEVVEYSQKKKNK